MNNNELIEYENNLIASVNLKKSYIIAVDTLGSYIQLSNNQQEKIINASKLLCQTLTTIDRSLFHLSFHRRKELLQFNELYKKL